MCYAPVICIPGSLGAGDFRVIAGPKCRPSMSPGSAVDVPGFYFPAKIPFYTIFFYNKWEAQSVHVQSDQLLSRCLDEHVSWNRKYGCKIQNKGLLIKWLMCALKLI